MLVILSLIGLAVNNNLYVKLLFVDLAFLGLILLFLIGDVFTGFVNTIIFFNIILMLTIIAAETVVGLLIINRYNRVYGNVASESELVLP